MGAWSRRGAMAAGLAACCGWAPAWTQASPGGGWVCPPCGCAADGRVFDAPGRCPACGMALVPTADGPPAPGALPAGSGAFTVPGGARREDARITVHYHRPASFRPDSPVLLVLPGTGRNGGPYRDAWTRLAEARGVLVAALAYPEDQYDFAAYHLGGTVRNLRLPPTGGASVIRLRDEEIRFEVETDRSRWLFGDFDRVFGVLAAAAGARRERYDLFGHSAGGQVLHRLALFHPTSRADRIVAANAGFYTLPDLSLAPLPGLKGTGLTPDDLRAALASRLTVLLGEEDNDPEGGGTMLHTPAIDRQGLHRLARGRTFFEAGRRAAAGLDAPFAWRLQTVPGVGHDFRGMARAAGELLYP
ncbi:hypothetical protein PHZ_c2776 [Phenylobacterium zucineum HLK1]|uniref:Heavy metal binding domain-containing protein n=1 Tax=Phenylobacterium zucineum (strain HLK1) TaxID=450851 RepID=B4R867_PHEZH|nr:heavy metal-binding domain-containing protein [Phenylobacterium zucineum]ACG79185.1 hypothetical protein PHZ_c2776 [Phenylobacterium zucineum HLK1]